MCGVWKPNFANKNWWSLNALLRTLSGMRNQRKTGAIVLHTTDIFDSDRSYLLFTREMGKIRARAKGVRKPTSRLGGHLLPFIETTIEAIQTGGDWWLIVTASVGSDISQYPDNPLSFLQQGKVVAESVDKIIVDGEPHPELFDGLVYTLDRLRNRAIEGEQDPYKLLIITAEFLFKCICQLGYRPELEQCVVTGKPIGEEGGAWSSELGGVVSKEAMQGSHYPLKALSYPRTIVALRQLARDQFVAERLGMPDELRQEVCSTIFNYIQTHVGKPLKSYEFFSNLV